MKKIFKQGESRSALYCETYEVKYLEQDEKTKYWEGKSLLYHAASKGSQKAVEARFKKDMKDKRISLLSIVYC